MQRDEAAKKREAREALENSRSEIAEKAANEKLALAESALKFAITAGEKVNEATKNYELEKAKYEVDIAIINVYKATNKLNSQTNNYEIILRDYNNELKLAEQRLKQEERLLPFLKSDPLTKKDKKLGVNPDIQKTGDSLKNTRKEVEEIKGRIKETEEERDTKIKDCKILLNEAKASFNVKNQRVNELQNPKMSAKNKEHKHISPKHSLG